MSHGESNHVWGLLNRARNSILPENVLQPFVRVFLGALRFVPSLSHNFIRCLCLTSLFDVFLNPALSLRAIQGPVWFE